MNGKCLILLTAFVACSNDVTPKSPVATTDSRSAPRRQPQKAAVDNSHCPATGLWAVCSVEKRLKQAGFVAQKNDSVLPPKPGLFVKPVTYTLNRSRLELYFYPDSEALKREIAKLDTAALAPVFIRAGNLAALLFSDDAMQRERVSLALTAGAPQPAR